MASSSLQCPSYLLTGGRVLLSVHFLSEVYDKLTRFKYWVAVCKASGQPFPIAEMLLVTALLLFGAPCLLCAKMVPQACLALVIFQVPTTYFFESSLYTQLDSVSVIGGLFIAAAIDWDTVHQQRNPLVRQETELTQSHALPTSTQKI